MGRLLPTLLILNLFIGPSLANATLFESTSYDLIDPVVNFPGGFSSSDSFRLQGAIGQPAIGTSDSGSYQVKGGFLYFAAPAEAGPSPTPTPTPTPTGGGPYLDIFKKFIEKILIRGIRADLNLDGFVDLYDAGILFYWWGKPLVQPNFASLLAVVLGRGLPSPDLNDDKIIDIFDLSIMLANWTG